MSRINIALSKGRILDSTLPIFARAKITPLVNIHNTRKLIIPTTDNTINFILTRASDAPTYVANGVCDLGIAGYDMILENNFPSIYELLDLKIAQCKMVLAGNKELYQEKFKQGNLLHVASKYSRITKNYIHSRGKQVKVVKLLGSMEIAPITGIADFIVDLVDTGATLKENNLEILEEIVTISSRLIVNKNAYKYKLQDIFPVLTKLQQVI